MGNLVMPKHDGRIEEFLFPLLVLEPVVGWMDKDVFIDEVYKLYCKNKIQHEWVPDSSGNPQKKQDTSDYTKDLQVSSYFGFAEANNFTRNSSKHITDLGKQLLNEYRNAGNTLDCDSIKDLFLISLQKVSFGRNNYGAITSDSDIEPPAIFFKSAIIMDGLSINEYAFILDQMHYKQKDFSSVITLLKKIRATNSPINSRITTDIKWITFLRNINIIVSVGNNRYTICDYYINNKYDEICELPIYNINKKVQNINLNIANLLLENNLAQPKIFYGAPGTGKTRHLQKEIYDKFDVDARVFTTFHQSYSYEDFVEGLKPILNSGGKDVEYHIEKGVFYEACEKAAKLAGYKDLKDCIADTKEDRVNKFNTAIDADKIMLICIDEINRGNVASIFGDLISLIEPSKRLGAGEYEMIVTLPYSKDKFGVPANLLIVGTMNTADRSIQLLDSALRRRFEFVEMAPNLDAIADGNAKTILQNINNRIRCLLNKDNQIGHSYFVNAKNNSDILKAIVYKIIPLLEEYFYNDIDKIRFVLNETDKVDNPFYKEDKDAAMAYQLYPEGIDEPKSFFKLDDGIKDILDEEDECAKYLEHLLK
ncbi:MAG: AAA family ATPase [Bacteroidales bacterium]|nr:AAA family ATPase [Bacteroidales bacterium]